MGLLSAAVSAVLAAYNTLSPEDRDRFFDEIRQLRLESLAACDPDAARYLASLMKVGEHLGAMPTSESYKQAHSELLAADEEVLHVSSIIRYYGSWRMAKEALELSGYYNARQVEARFRRRRTRQPRYAREDELRAALHSCVADLGRAPLIREYEDWCDHQRDQARARGEELWLPSVSTFRRRHKTWEKALLHYGIDLRSVYARLEQPRQPRKRLAKVDRYTDETLEQTLRASIRSLGRVPLSEQFEAWRRRELKRRRADKIVLPSTAPYRRRFGSWQSALLHFGVSRQEIDELLAAATERGLKNLAPRFRSNGSLSEASVEPSL